LFYRNVLTDEKIAELSKDVTLDKTLKCAVIRAWEDGHNHAWSEIRLMEEAIKQKQKELETNG
jgi:hypothetical protein